MKRLLKLAVLMALILSMSGCGKPEKPDEIWAACQKASAGVQCTKMDTDLSMGFSMGYSALGSDYSVRTEAKASGVTTTTLEPFSSLTDMTLDMSVSGPGVGDQQFSTESQVYTLAEDGEIVSYTKSDGIWLRSETGLKQEDMLQYADAVQGAADLTFQKDESVTEWDGKSAVCLTTTVTGDAVQTLLDTAMQALSAEVPQTFGDLDLAALTCQMRVYIDTKTWLPLAQEMTVTGMDELLNDALASGGVEMEMDTCTVTVRYLSFEPQEPIQLPEGVKEKAQKWGRLLDGNPDNGDGTYTIRDGLVMADVATPEGMEGCGFGTEKASFMPEDGSWYVAYTIYSQPVDDPVFTERLEETAALCEEQGIPYQLDTEKITVNSLVFDCAVMTMEPREGVIQGYRAACAPIAEEDGMAYFVEVQILNGSPGDTQADNGQTMEDLIGYLEYITPCDLMD